MKHLSDGTLRRMIDEPLAIADSDRRHYRACSHCQEQGVQIAALADTTARIFDAAPAPLDTARAFAQVSRRVATQGSKTHAGRVSLPRVLRRAVRPAGGVAAALALVGALALTPAGSLAQTLITIFQPQQISTVQVTTHDLRQLSGLARYGTFPCTGTRPHAAGGQCGSGFRRLRHDNTGPVLSTGRRGQCTEVSGDSQYFRIIHLQRSQGPPGRASLRQGSAVHAHSH